MGRCGMLLLGLTVMGVSAVAEVKAASKPDPYGLVTCSTTTESRTLAIATKEGGCELHYEKHGKDKVISWSVNDVSRCVNSQTKVRKELEAAGWKCIQE